MAHDNYRINYNDLFYVITVYVGEEQVEEPDFVYIPESHQITSSATGANALDASLMLLQESLESGAALAQFDVSVLT